MRAAADLESGRLDPYNAVSIFGEAVLLALAARNRELAEQSLGALRGAASHAAMASLAIRVGEAGIAALDGNSDAARAALLATFEECREIGATRRQALTGLLMAILLGHGDPRVRAAIDESRRLFEQMGAGLWLALLDTVLAGSDAPATPRAPASPSSASPAPTTAAPA